MQLRRSEEMVFRARRFRVCWSNEITIVKRQRGQGWSTLNSSIIIDHAKLRAVFLPHTNLIEILKTYKLFDTSADRRKP